MAALFARIRDRSPIRGGSTDLSPVSPDANNLFSSLNSAPPTQINGSISPPNSPGNPKSRNSSRSPSDKDRIRSNSSGLNSLAPFPTPFHAFKLNPVSTKNQVNALKFIDRIDSLLFLGHPATAVFNALPACMANAEAQAWFTRTLNSDIHKPASLDDFRQCLINDHIWAFEQNRIMSRYQSRSAGNRRDPYLDSAEFKLHLAYIRDAVRLEEQLLQKDKKIAGAYSELSELHEKETQLQKKISNLQYDLARKESGAPAAAPQQAQELPKTQVTAAAAITNTREMDDLRDQLKQLDRMKTALQDEVIMQKNNVAFLEQQKTALNHEITNLRIKVSDLEASNQRLRTLADAVPTMQAKISDLEARNARMQQHMDSVPPGQDLDLQRLREQNARFITQLNQKDTKISELEAEVQTHSGAAQQHQHQSQQHQQAAQVAQQSSQQLQQQLNQVTAHNQQLQQQLQQAQQQLQQFQQDSARAKSPPYPSQPGLMEATRSMDDAFANMNLSHANLEAIIKQKDTAIADLHARLTTMTDEAAGRVQRLFQIEQSLLDSHAISRHKDMALFNLERRLAMLGHHGDCNCPNCSQFPKSATPVSLPTPTSSAAPVFKTPVHTNSAPIPAGTHPYGQQQQPPHVHHNSIDLGVAAAAAAFASQPNTGNVRASLMGPSPSQQSVSTNVSRTATPLIQQQAAQLAAQQQQQVQNQGRRFLDIRFRYSDPRPYFVPEQSKPTLAHLLDRGMTVLHPGADFSVLWENITKALLEMLGSDLGLLGELTKHLKLSFRDRDGSPPMYGIAPNASPRGLVVADVWFGVWQEVNGLDIVCDF